MFNEQYILELLSGELSVKGYASILGTISSLVKWNHWPKSIIVSGTTDKEWAIEDIKELTQMYFEWVIVHHKLKYLSKIPYEYLPYYFTQMLISFIADRIKEEQQKVGISYQKCRDYVKTICEEDYVTNVVAGKSCIRSADCTNDKVVKEIIDIIKYMPHFPIYESTKHIKPIIKIVIEDILANVDGYLSIETLCNAVYLLLDQSSLFTKEPDCCSPEEPCDNERYSKPIKEILSGINQADASLFSEYIFQNAGKISLAELALKYSIPKSTLHNRLESFKRKIFAAYMPESEDDGVLFLQNLAKRLDEISK